MPTHGSSERGAILIHVALAIVVVIGFNAFVVDYGVMWAARRMAQNAADAGALAGAVALAFDDYDDRTATGPAKTSAHRMATLHTIWGAAPAVNIATDITFPSQPAACAEGACVRVNVYRTPERGNPLPALFGGAIGMLQQGVQAMAIARVAVANASDCLKPWAIPDKWNDIHDTTAPIDTEWKPDDTFDRLYPSGPNRGQPLPNPDVYTAPTASDPGTGFTVEGVNNDLGVELVLKAGSPQDAIAPGFFLPIRLPQADGESTGGDDYRENIATCNGIPLAIGETLQSEPGNMIGPTKQGVQDLIDLDPDADWDPATKSVINSCAQDPVPCAPRSPRIVAMPVFDTGVYYDGKQNGLVTLRIANILGFFIDRIRGNDVIGYLVMAPGLVTGASSITSGASFLKSVVLVR